MIMTLLLYFSSLLNIFSHEMSVFLLNFLICQSYITALEEWCEALHLFFHANDHISNFAQNCLAPPKLRKMLMNFASFCMQKLQLSFSKWVENEIHSEGAFIFQLRNFDPIFVTKGVSVCKPRIVFVVFLKKIVTVSFQIS